MKKRLFDPCLCIKIEFYKVFAFCCCMASVIVLANEPMVPKKIVTIGSSMPITARQVKNFALAAYQGIFAALYDFNNSSKSTIPYIREYILDDSYNPQKAHSNIQFLKDNNINVLLMPLGTATIQSYLADVKTGNVVIFFPNMEGRHPDIQNMVHCRATYSQEAEALIRHVLKKGPIKRCAIFYQNDLFGIGPRDVAHAIFKEKKIEYVDVAYEAKSVSFVKQAEQILQSDVDAIVFFCFTTAATSIIRNMKPYNLINKKLLGISDLLVGNFPLYAQSLGLNFTFSSITPSPEKSNIPIAKQYREAMYKHVFTLNMFSFAAYIAARLFLEAFQKMDYVLDAPKMIEYFEQMHDVDFYGLTLSFGSNRSVLNSVWIVENVNDDWVLYTTK